MTFANAKRYVSILALLASGLTACNDEKKAPKESSVKADDAKPKKPKAKLGTNTDAPKETEEKAEPKDKGAKAAKEAPVTGAPADGAGALPGAGGAVPAGAAGGVDPNNPFGPGAEEVPFQDIMGGAGAGGGGGAVSADQALNLPPDQLEALFKNASDNPDGNAFAANGMSPGDAAKVNDMLKNLTPAQAQALQAKGIDPKAVQAQAQAQAAAQAGAANAAAAGNANAANAANGNNNQPVKDLLGKFGVGNNNADAANADAANADANAAAAAAAANNNNADGDDGDDGSFGAFQNFFDNGD